jgi:predicted metal-binding membrane protein
MPVPVPALARRAVSPVPLVAALAATLLVAWVASPWAGYLDHGHEPGPSLGAHAAALAAYELAWVLMILAMMLPSAMSLLDAVGALGRGLRLRTALGFVATWAVVGYAFRALDVVVHATADSVGWLAGHPQAVAALTLAIAGAFQFSDLKHRCLTACRSPQSFVYRGWHGADAAADARRIGMAYGLSCVGCCWALMLVMFAVGMTNLLWMLALAAVMSVERHVARTPLFGRTVGVALLAAAVVTAA